MRNTQTTYEVYSKGTSWLQVSIFKSHYGLHASNGHRKSCSKKEYQTIIDSLLNKQWVKED